MNESLKALGRSAVRLYMQSPFRGKSRLRNAVCQWLSPAGDVEKVHVGPCAIDLDHRQEATRNMAYGCYEVNELELLRRVLRAGDTAVDVGANVGYLSAKMAEHVGLTGKVYSFEPGPTPFRSLLAMSKSNRFANIEVFPMAVAEQVRQATYYETDVILSKGYGRIDQRPSERFENVRPNEVAVTSLAAFFSSRPVDRLRLIKIDVEGHEKQVVEGLVGLLERHIRPLLLTEVSMRESGLADCDSYRPILERYGYQMYSVGKTPSKLTTADLTKGFHGNVVWIAG